jgi:hypothetical protein
MKTKKGQRLWKKPPYDREERKGLFLLYSSSSSSSSRKDVNSRKQRSACLLTDLVCERNVWSKQKKNERRREMWD